jgi:fluoride exporter
LIWYVMLGSAVGGGARFLLGTFIQTRTGSGFPIGTLVVNISGSLLLAFVFRYAAGSSLSPEVRALLTTGFCGGYTTFSAFSWETLRLIEDGDYYRAAWYVGLSVIVSLAGAFAGIGLARELLDMRRRM